MPPEVRDQQLETIIPYYRNLSNSEMNDVVKIDSSLAAMQLMLVARSHGFEADQLAEAFSLDKNRYIPVMILSIGKAMETGYDSVCLDAEKLTTFK